MAKAVYRHGEIALANSKVILEPPFPELGKPELEETPDNADDSIFAGPNPAELQAEIEQRRTEIEKERVDIINAAHSEAETLNENAKNEAELCVSSAKNEAEELLQKAREESEKIINEAELRAGAIISEAEAKRDETIKAAESEGHHKGRAAGYEEGFLEVKRLAARTQTVLERLQDRRAEVLAEAERDIIELTLIVARKVIKTISENQRGIVVENIKEALSKIKTKGKAIVKVNLADLKLATEQIEEFTKLIEGPGNIQILEDSSVDSGGCVVQTDFGEIDARIASQFAELESRILELSPMKQKAI